MHVAIPSAGSSVRRASSWSAWRFARFWGSASRSFPRTSTASARSAPAGLEPLGDLRELDRLEGRRPLHRRPERRNPLRRLAEGEVEPSGEEEQPGIVGALAPERSHRGQRPVELADGREELGVGQLQLRVVGIVGEERLGGFERRRSPPWERASWSFAFRAPAWFGAALSAFSTYCIEATSSCWARR